MKYTIAFYNLENFYDYRVREGDIQKRSWTKERYKTKLNKVAGVLAIIGEEETQRKPAFIGVCEVEDREVVQDLCNTLDKDGYNFVHKDSLDERGMDTAFIYDTSVFLVLNTDFIQTTFNREDGSFDYTRDITYVKGELVKEKEQLHFFVVHLPSKREHNINQPHRIHILDVLRCSINNVLEEDKDARIILIGDFNENPDADYLVEELKVSSAYEELNQEKDMYNPFIKKYWGKNASLFYNKKGELFDQMVFSKSFFAVNAKVKYVEADIFSVGFLQNKERNNLGTPWRTYVGTRYMGGYSDHFPIYSIIETVE